MKKPNYPILKEEDLSTRDQIKLVPEDELDPLTNAELCNLRDGIKYTFTVADTPANRENFNFKVLYFQMVAYKEGWEFKPENFQVVYVDPSDPRVSQEARIMEFSAGSENRQVSEPYRLPYRISPQRRLGFRVDEQYANQMRPEEADDLGAKVIKLFK